MKITDLNDCKIEVTDLKEAIKIAKRKTGYSCEDKSLVDIDKRQKAYWRDMYEKLLEQDSKVVESIYIIRNYDMIGSSFKTFEKLNFDKVEKVNDIFRCVKDKKIEVWNSGKYYTVSEKPEGENYNKIFLPYFADVTEDVNIPIELEIKGLEPKMYKNCQLMTQKKGSYYYFYSHAQKKALLIAMNSHYYKPVNNQY